MSRRILTVAAVLLAIPPGTADARVKWIRGGACEVVTDAVGDVRLNDIPASQAAGDKHLDVTDVYVLSRGKTVDLTIYTEALNGRRRGTFVVTFTAGKTSYAAQAVTPPWPNLSAGVTYSAGVAGRLVAVTGSVDLDNSTITVSAPYSVFGAAGRKGTTWSRFAVRAEEMLIDLPVPAPPEPRLHDIGTSTNTYRTGSTCTPPLLPPPPPPRAGAARVVDVHYSVDSGSGAAVSAEARTVHDAIVALGIRAERDFLLVRFAGGGSRPAKWCGWWKCRCPGRGKFSRSPSASSSPGRSSSGQLTTDLRLPHGFPDDADDAGGGGG